MADEEDYSSLPLEQRLEHKVWKVRMKAYTDLTKELKQLDPEREAGKFAGYESLLAKMVLDSNMAAQESGVQAVIAFVDNAPNPVRRREEIVAGVVAKCLAATKAGTRSLSKELLLLMSEVDTPGPVVQGVLEGFEAKQPKAVVASLSAVRDIVRAFGIKFINLKQLLKALSKPFAHRDNSVRTEAQHVAVELYRWMRQAIMPSLQDLPPVLLKELEAQFAQVDQQPPPTQERLLRSQQQQQEQADAPSESAQGENPELNDADSHEDVGANMDPWDLADPVDIAQKLPNDFNMLVGSKKWKERKEALEQLHETLKKSIRLQMSSGTGDVVQELGNKISDTNIIVATLAIQSLELIARGLRQPFAPYVQSTLPALVEKSKERKQSVVDAIRATMDAYFAAAVNCDLTAIGDHYFTGATHKNPQARAEAHRFLSRCFAVVPKRPSKGEVKRYTDQLKAGLDDGDAGVREAAAEGLGTLSKLVTAKVLDPFIEGVDKIKMEKINEFAEKATVKAKSAAPAPAAPRAAPSGKPRPRPSAAPAKPAASASTQAQATESESGGLGANLPPHIRKKLEASARAAAIKKAQREGRPIDDLLPPAQPEPSAPAAKPPASRPAAAAPPKRPAAAASSRKPATGKTKPGAPAKPAASEAVTMKYANDESLDEKIAEVLPADVLASLNSAKWKERMEAMDQLKEFLGDEAARSNAVHAELVVRQLGRKPGWKESNFQVTLRSFQLIGWMAEEASVEFNTGAVALAVPALVDKLGDIKLKAAAGAALVAMAERFTLQLVIGQAIEPIRAQKSPKVIADCLAWLNTQLVDFGVQGVRLRMVVDVVRDVGLQSSNAQTRATAVTLMGTLRRAAGPAILDLAGDLNSQLVQLLEAEFARVGEEKLPEPKLTQRGLATAGDSSGSGGRGGSGSTAAEATDDAMDELFPRQDLQALLGAGIYKQLGDSNWKERKAGLEAIQAALAAANNRIQPNIPGDLYVALKLRLTDPNKNLVTVALTVLGELSQASGAALVPNIRVVALSTMHCLADKKPPLRTAALAALSAWAEANPHCVEQAIVPAIPTALGESSPELRTALLRWTADTLTKHARLPDLSGLITPLFSCLQDRTAEVRKQATRVLGLVVKSCGFETVHDACSLQLRGAARTTVAPVIEEFRATAAAAAAAEHTPARRAPASAAVRPARAESPAAEPVMTASELLGRAPPPVSAPAASTATTTAPAGARTGVLRRPMAVRRPTGSAQGPPAAAAPPSRGASGLGRMSAEELAHVAPVVDSDERAKEQRARRDAATNTHGVPRWAQLGDARVRTELETQLREQAAAHLNPLVCRQLFSTGHYRDRDHLAGLTALDEAVDVSEGRFNLALHGPDSLAARYAAHVDLLLKYASLRMYDGSTHTLLKSFDLLERLAQLATQTNTRWSEYEVQAIVPALISRLGDAKEAVRVRARRILTQQLPQISAPARLFSALVDYGVGNRTSARVRQEALDCVRTLLGRERASAGLSAICAQPTRVVPVFAQAVGDRDSSVRAAALHVLVTLAEQLPGGADDLWRLCGRMPEKERAMLEERLRRSALTESSRPGSSIGRPASGIGRPISSIGRPGSSIGRPMSGIGRPVPAAAAATHAPPVSAPAHLPPAAPVHRPPPGASRPMFSLDFDNLNLPSYSAATSEQLGVSGSRPNSDAAIGFNAGRSQRLRAALHDTSPGRDSSDRRNSAAATISEMRSVDPAIAMERLHALVRVLDSETVKVLQAHMGALCEASAVVLKRASASASDGLRRSLLALLMDVFMEQRLALWAPQNGVRELLRGLVATLVDPRLSPSASADGAQLHRAVNALMVRILDRSDRTAVLLALVALLDAAAHTPLPQPPSSPDDILRAGAGDIVMRCLWRLSKNLPQDLQTQFAGCADATFISPATANPAVGDFACCRSLRVDAVLLMTHRFFRHTPNREWRRREDQDRWTFGDLPKRTVKTISHSLVLALRSAVWLFVTPLLRDVMRASPNLLPAAPASGPSAAWVDAVHSAMIDASEAWEYLARALRDANSSDCPRPQQLYDAFIAAASSSENGDEDDLDADNVAPFGTATHSPSLGRPPSRTSASSLSPRLQQQRVLHGTSSPDRTRSPVSLRESSSSYIPTPAARPQTSTHPSFERLKALRDRIGGARPQQQQQQQPSGRMREAVTSSIVSSRSISPTSSTTAASPELPTPAAAAAAAAASVAVNERRRENQQQQPAPSIDDIRERINMMRNSLRSDN